MRDAFINEALSDIAVGRGVGRLAPSNCRFLHLAIAAVSQQVVGVARTHDASTRKGKRHTRSIDRDPSAAPLLSNIGGCARSTGWIDHEVARVGSHENTPLYRSNSCLHDIRFVSGRCGIQPNIVQRGNPVVVEKEPVPDGPTALIRFNAVGMIQPLHPLNRGLPRPASGRIKVPSSELERIHARSE